MDWIVLGNQLFPKKYYQKATSLFMCEDIDLCTHYRYHKHKIILFLSAMRSFADQFENVNYFKLEDQSHFFKKLEFYVDGKSEIYIYEIEDKFFEKKILDFFVKRKIKLIIHPSPMFLCTREGFQAYLKGKKRPFMKTFYEHERNRLQIMMKGGKPEGGKYSFDDENRKKIPKKFDVIQNYIGFEHQGHVSDVIKLVDETFKDHPGESSNYWIPVTRNGALKTLDHFIKYKLEHFGDYQDALDDRDPFLYHSLISPYINMGLITPDEVVKIVETAKAPINAKEGFIRQVMGWREFVRGIYQNYSEREDSENFFNHHRKMKKTWWEGETGLPPVDEAIKKAIKYGYCHHIERLMVLSNVMLMSEILPQQVHQWFMEMFVDSSDWVMGPNVYGMGQFSDGGIFATKPYISGSNYIKKMGHYGLGDWCDVMDGLYWSFIENKRDFFATQGRMSFMLKNLDKMDLAKKQRIYQAKDLFLKMNTT